MKATLKLPYNYYNDGSFDVDPSYYKDGEYGERMNDEFNKTSESVYNVMSDSNKCVSRAFLSRDEQSCSCSTDRYLAIESHHTVMKGQHR